MVYLSVTARVFAQSFKMESILSPSNTTAGLGVVEGDAPETTPAEATTKVVIAALAEIGGEEAEELYLVAGDVGLVASLLVAALLGAVEAVEDVFALFVGVFVLCVGVLVIVVVAPIIACRQFMRAEMVVVVKFSANRNLSLYSCCTYNLFNSCCRYCRYSCFCCCLFSWSTTVSLFLLL